jgi:hypothetical protein
MHVQSDAFEALFTSSLVLQYTPLAHVVQIDNFFLDLRLRNMLPLRVLPRLRASFAALAVLDAPLVVIGITK